MKGCKIYFLKIIKEFDQNLVPADDYFAPFYQELAHIINLDDAKYFGFTKNDEILLHLEEFQLKKVIAHFEQYFEISLEDVTDKVINGEMQKIYPEVEELTPDFFYNFRIENTSIDDILDKINNSGSESLDYIDTTIINLNNNKKL
jgi:hypothetical protein